MCCQLSTDDRYLLITLSVRRGGRLLGVTHNVARVSRRRLILRPHRLHAVLDATCVAILFCVRMLGTAVCCAKTAEPRLIQLGALTRVAQETVCQMRYRCNRGKGTILSRDDVGFSPHGAEHRTRWLRSALTFVISRVLSTGVPIGRFPAQSFIHVRLLITTCQNSRMCTNVDRVNVNI